MTLGLAMPTHPRALILGTIVLLCLLWGSTWWAIRICLEYQPPLSAAALRFVLAGAAMALVAPRLRRHETGSAPPPWLWLCTGLCNFAGSYGILYVAEQHVPSGIAAVLWAVFPLLMALSGVLVLGETIRPRQWLGFLLAFSGIVAVFAGDLGGQGEVPLGHALLLLGSPVVSAIGTTLVKRHGAGCSSVLLNRNGMLAGAGLLVLAALVAESPTQLQYSTSWLLATLYLAVFGTAVTFGAYFWLLRTAPASQLALISYATPVLAMLLAAAVGDGKPDALAWFGTALVVAGIAVVVHRGRRRS